MNSKEQEVIDKCELYWPSYQNNCGQFIKAVCDALGIQLETDIPDQIITIFRDEARGWSAITDEIDGRGRLSKRREEIAGEKAGAGKLVVCCLDGHQTNIGQSHIAIVIAASLAFATKGGDYFPIGYWGSSLEPGKAKGKITDAVPEQLIDRLLYFATDLI